MILSLKAKLFLHCYFCRVTGKTMSKQNSFRRSERRKRDTLLEKFAEPAENVGVRVEYFEEKGRGVVADKDFKKGDYVIEYVGDRDRDRQGFICCSKYQILSIPSLFFPLLICIII
jgi:SET domain-containing protein